MPPSGQMPPSELATGFEHPHPSIGVLTAKTYERGGLRVLELWQHARGYEPVMLARDYEPIRKHWWRRAPK